MTNIDNTYVHPKKISNGLPLVASNSKSSAINSGSNSSLINSIQQNNTSVNYIIYLSK